MKASKAFLVVTFLLLMHFPYSQEIVINEVQTDNVNTIVDEDGEFSAWIELYNPSDEIIHLQDYGLTNDLDKPFLWTFPKISLPPNEHLLVFASGKNKKTLFNYHWETLINRGDLWKYKIGNAATSANWKQSDFNDKLWNEGPSGFGYGDADDATILGSRENPIQSVYIRKTFTIDDVNEIAALVLHIDYDDGFIAYINGKEVTRANMGLPGSPADYNTQASPLHEADMYDGDPPNRFNLEKTVLISGLNTICIEGHNGRLPSSDLSLIPFLSVLMNEVPLGARGTPDAIQLENKTTSLHSNFILEYEKNSLAIVSPDSLIGDTLFANNIPINDSKGLNAPGQVVTFKTPTPGYKNAYGSMIYGQLDPVIFSKESGFFKGPVNIALRSNYEDGIIRYTTDGSTPGRGSKIYSKPIRVSETGIVKAYVFGGLYAPSEVSSKVFFIDEQNSLPVINITHNQEEFFSAIDGIYGTGNNVSSTWPYSNANYWKNIQRRVSVSYFDTEGTKQFNLNGSASISGGESRTYPQKSLKILLDDNQSPFQLFPDGPLSSLKSFTLSNGDNDWAHTMINESFMQNIVRNLDLDLRHRQHCIVYLNGKYWGIHELQEDIDLAYMKRRSKINEDKAALLCYNSRLSPVASIGLKKDYELLWHKVNTSVVLSDAKINDLSKDVDLNNLINYYIFQIYIANTQWPGKNQCFWHNGLNTGKWRWIPSDFEYGFGLSIHGDKHYGHYNPNAYQHSTLHKVFNPGTTQDINPYYSTVFIRRLVSNPTFKALFINRFADLLNTNFLPENVHSISDESAEILSDEIERHFERWSSFLRLNSALEWRTSLEWDLRIKSLKDFASKRHPELFKQIATQFDLSEKESIIHLSVNDPASGFLKLNSLELSLFPWEGRYFKTLPVHIVAVAKEGYAFKGWNGTSETSADIWILPEEAKNLEAIFEKESSKTPIDVVINEINYFAEGNGSGGEWIELYNAGNQDVNLSAWRIGPYGTNLAYEFPDDFILAKGEYIVVVQDIGQFIVRHPGIYNIIGEADFDMPNIKGSISLHSESGKLMDSVAYSSSLPWPNYSNQNVKTLALLSPFSNNLRVVNWKIADGFGTPGEANYSFFTDVDDLSSENDVLAYPNPFRDQVTIVLNAQESRSVRLDIYDLQGRLIDANVVNTSHLNKSVFIWDGTTSHGNRLPGGIYYCRVSGTKVSKTLKLFLLH